MLEISLALLSHGTRTEALHDVSRASMSRKISRLHCLGEKKNLYPRGGTLKDVAKRAGPC